MTSHVKVARESTWVQIAGVVVFAALVYVLANLTHPQLTGAPLIAVGIVLAVVPAGLWLWLFYDEDRFEPEPRQLVIGVFVLGALLAYAVGQPALRSLFRVQDWLTTNALTGILGSILVVGFIQQFLLYATVRYSIFYSSEFDQRVDGIIYGAAAGLGYATMMNILYIVQNNGVDLGIGVMRVTVEALSLASLGGISGYFLARAKFDKMGPVWLPLGLAIAAALNGLIEFALDEVPTLGAGFGFNPWYGLVLAVIIAGVVFTLLIETIHRLETAGAGAASAQQGSVLDKVLVGEGKQEEPEWVVWAVVAVALIAGWLFASYIQGQTRTATAGGMTLSYPSSWTTTKDSGADFAAYDLSRGGIYGARVSLWSEAKSDVFPAQGTLDDAAANWGMMLQSHHEGFRLLNIERTQAQGREAAQVEYAYLASPPQSTSSGTMPALMHAVDTLVVGGDRVYVLAFAAQSQDYSSLAGLRDQLLANWRVPQ